MTKITYSAVARLRRLLSVNQEVECARLARKADTTPLYLAKLAGGFGLPSMTMADRLVALVPGLKLSDFMAARRERLEVGPRYARRRRKVSRRA